MLFTTNTKTPGLSCTDRGSKQQGHNYITNIIIHNYNVIGTSCQNVAPLETIQEWGIPCLSLYNGPHPIMEPGVCGIYIISIEWYIFGKYVITM